jgi:hypothetical protein
MMAAVYFQVPYTSVVVNGLPVPYAKLYFSTTLTTTPLPTYTTAALSTVHASPVRSMASGRVPDIYLDSTKTYRLRIYDKNDSLLEDIDPFIPGTVPSAGALQPYQDAAEDAAAEASGYATTATTQAGIATTKAGEASADADAAAADRALAQAAATAASTSIASVPNATAHAATRIALSGLSSSNGPAYLKEAGREGMFVWDGSDLSDEVTLDPQEGVYVAPASDDTGASGAWVRQYSGPVNIEWFGAVSGGVTDCYDAIQAAINFFPTGGAISVPGKNYRSSAKLVQNVAIHWIGELVASNAAVAGYITSTITFDSGIGGIYGRFVTSDDLSGAADIPGSSGTIIEHIRFLSPDNGAVTAGAYGIEFRAHVTLNNVEVRGFGDHGVHLRGSLGGSDGVVYGNVNASNLNDVRSLYNGGAGFRISGNDANQIQLSDCHAQGNTGWGFDDDSLIGSVYLTPLTESNTAGGFITRRAAAPSLFLGGNHEGQALDLDAACDVIGGAMGQAVGTGAFTMSGGLAQSLPIRHLNSVGTPVGAQLGSTSERVALAFGASGGENYATWKLVYNPGGTTDAGSWGYVASGSSSTIFLAFPDPNVRQGRLYAAEFPRGIVIGEQGVVGSLSKLITTGTVVPASGTWVQSDLVISRSITSASAPYQWACTAAGTPGTWVADYLYPRADPTTGIGYVAGAGGTVTQTTSKSTDVTLNKICGEITLHNASLAANTAVTFTLTNSAVAAGDRVIINHVSGGTFGAYVADARAAAGSATVMLRNLTAGALGEAVVLGFAIVKAATA